MDDGGEIEGRAAALFRDLLDSANEDGDDTYYSGRYVFEVFRTCDVRVKGQWQDRNDVSDHDDEDIRGTWIQNIGT